MKHPPVAWLPTKIVCLACSDVLRHKSGSILGRLLVAVVHVGPSTLHVHLECVFKTVGAVHNVSISAHIVDIEQLPQSCFHHN